jgi:glyceraldehyde 3-phosphate dehydrogenase
LPWKKLGVDAVLECTGVFTKKEDAEKHLEAGAKAVIISAPSKSEGVTTVVRSVNEEKAVGQKIVANASCTTNCCAPVMAVLAKKFGVEKALLSTVHAMTASQRIVDSPNTKDWREGRAASANIIPSSTGAAIATALVLPELKNKFDGVSFRVPVVCGSVVDIVALLKKNVTPQSVNDAFKKASQEKRFSGVLETTEEDLVSSDILGTTASAIVDLRYTRVVGGNLVKIVVWYDNEWAYANRLVEMVEFVISAKGGQA